MSLSEHILMKIREIQQKELQTNIPNLNVKINKKILVNQVQQHI